MHILSCLTIHRATADQMPPVRATIERDHYLHRWPDPRSLPFAYVLLPSPLRKEGQGVGISSDDRPLGIVVFKKPQHHKQRGLFGYEGLPTAWQVLDMARVWVHPILQRPGYNVFSRMVSLALRRVQYDWLQHHPPRFPHLPYHIELIISYCELAHHDGTAYKACSFTSAGLTADGTKELYIKRLRRPRKSWQPTVTYQVPLLAGFPLVHERNIP